MKRLNKILISIILIMSLSSSAFAAKVGYTNRVTFVYKQASTASQKLQLPLNTKVYVMSAKGSFYSVYNSKKTTKGYIFKTHLSQHKTKVTTSNWKNQVIKMNWFSEGKNLVKKGQYAYLYLITTGETIKVKRMGGTNHADIEPAKISDTQKLYGMTDYNWSWKTYPVILIANNKYVAASINTQPHDSQTIDDNDFMGQICLHLSNSRTHGSNKINQEHQKTINDAYNWAH